jgi:hypothetical protein
MEFHFPWEGDHAPTDVPVPRPEAESRPKPRGRRPASVARSAALAMGASPAWLYHHLTISGPAALVTELAAAAHGSGVIPWQLDFGLIQEDLFNRAASQPAARRSLTIAGCHILARQFRERIEMRQAKAVALVGRSRACPFDLHVLLPVPAAILQLGPTHPASLAWLSEHWGTTDRLRQVALRQKPTIGQCLPAGHAVIGYSFFTPHETPHAAIAWLGALWPALHVVLQPRPAD